MRRSRYGVRGAFESGKQRTMRIGALSLRKQQLQVTVRIHRISEQETLYVRTVHLLQEIELILCLDTFRYNVHFEAAPHLNDSTDNGCVIGVRDDISYKRLVDLERADRELL